MTVTSPKFSLTREDLVKVLKDALIFAGPAILVLLASLIEAVPADFKYGVIVLYALNIVTDLFKRWLSENKYRI